MHDPVHVPNSLGFARITRVGSKLIEDAQILVALAYYIEQGTLFASVRVGVLEIEKIHESPCEN